MPSPGRIRALRVCADLGHIRATLRRSVDLRGRRALVSVQATARHRVSQEPVDASSPRTGALTAMR